MDYNLTEKNNELKTDLIHVKDVLNDCKSKMSFSTNDELLDNIDSIIEQIDNKTFTVSVIATIKAGKSTFLNALLGNEYLPSSNVPETSNLLFIRNSEETRLQKNKEVIKGITNIKNEIAERNKNDRENGVNTLNKYTLFVPYKKLDSLKNLNFQFVDTPGPNESGVPTLKNEVEKILKVSDVIIYLMDYGKLNSTDENELFSTISTIRKDLLSDIKSKVFFVVNKMDSKNTNSLNEEETINFVKEQLKKQLKIDSPNIYCISAENALLAKMIKVQNYKRIDDIGRKAFGAFGWNDDDKEDIKISKLIDTILEKFIEKSGVPRLEDKIINFIVSNSESLFYESIVSKVVNIIQEVKNVFFTKKKLMEKDEENLKKLENELSSKIDEIKKQLKDIDSIIKKVAQDIGKDIDNSFENFEKTITEFIKQFVTSKEKISTRNGIASDIEDFIDTGADFAIEKLAPGKNDKEKNKNKKVYKMIYKFGKATLKLAHEIIVNWNSSDVNKSEEKAKELNSYLIQYVKTGFASIKEDLEIEAKDKLNSVNFDIKKIINEANRELFSTVNSKLQLDENLKPIDIEIPLNDSFQINADYKAYIDKQQGKGGFCKPSYTVSVELNPEKIISFWTKEISRQKRISKKAVNEYIQVAIKEKIEETKKEFQKNATTFISLIQEQLRECKNKKETSEDNSKIIKDTISKIKEIENKVKLENSIL